MTNNSDKIVISWAWCLGCSGQFRAAFKHFQNLESHILNILKETLHLSYLVGSFRITVQTATISKAMIKFWCKFLIQIHWYSFSADQKCF